MAVHGVQEYADVPPMADTVWIRIVVLNTRTGLIGALDIPMPEADLAKVSLPPEELSAALGRPKARVPENPPSLLGYPVAFHSSSGRASALDGNGDKLSYHGDIGVEQTAPAYFDRVLGAKFHCENGELIPRNGSDEKPNLHFSFGNATGQAAEVDLTGGEPQYSGDLAVDSSAKPFFETLWYLCHCRTTPAPSGPSWKLKTGMSLVGFKSTETQMKKAGAAVAILMLLAVAALGQTQRTDIQGYYIGEAFPEFAAQSGFDLKVCSRGEELAKPQKRVCKHAADAQAGKGLQKILSHATTTRPTLRITFSLNAESSCW